MKYRPHHTAVSVRNLDKSVKFYESLGFKQVHRYDDEDGSLSIVHLKLGESFLELFFFKKNRDKPPVEFEFANNLDEIGVKHIALWTDNIVAALDDMKNKGYADENTKITVGRTKVNYFFIKDPDGMWVEFVKDERYL